MALKYYQQKLFFPKRACDNFGKYPIITLGLNVIYFSESKWEYE